MECACAPLYGVGPLSCEAVPVPLSWLGRHQGRVEDDHPFEVKHHGLQEGRELILGYTAVAHPLWTLGNDPSIRPRRCIYHRSRAQFLDFILLR